MNEASSLLSVKGVGEKSRKVFEKAGIYTVGDLLHYYPRDYETYEEITPIGEIYQKDVVASNDLILDSEAAARIEERGFSALTGVGTGEDLPFVAASEEWTEKGEAYHPFGGAPG